MPGFVDRGGYPQLPPKVYFSEPCDLAALLAEAEALDPAPRTWSPQEHTRTKSAEWEDIDERPRSRRKKSKRQSATKAPTEKVKAPRTPTTRGAGRFFSNLSQILEAGESVVGSRSSAKTPESGRKHRTKDSSKSHRRVEDNSLGYRRAARHKSLGLQRRQESLLRFNPSLLSVLSTMTGSSGNSGGSGSTITQSSFDRRGSESSKTPTSRPRRADSAIGQSIEEPPRSPSPNVFDFMQTPSINDTHDGNSVMSSASASRYEPSENDSSEAPTTPSSYSTFPSPGSTRRTSVAELRQRYDPQYSSSPQSSFVRPSSRSPDQYPRTARKQPSVSDVPEVDEQKVESQDVFEEPLPDLSNRRSSSRSSRSRSTSQRLRDKEESMRQHIAYAQQPQQYYYADRDQQQRSFSRSSNASDSAAYDYNTALQHYQHAPIPQHPPRLIQPLADDQALHQPPAPEAPDPTQKHIQGYELLATSLATPTAFGGVKPLYRKFSYLNHRILLHLQDELSELEEQLRTLDEMITHLDFPNGPNQPASRRAETYQGSQLHHQRRNLLGCIFVKTEQYNRSLASFSEMGNQGAPAQAAQVETYRDWLATHNPVHEHETRFLQHPGDLIDPTAKPTVISPNQPAEQTVPQSENAIAWLPLPLMLPFILFSVIPSLAGRLLATALIALAVFIAAATTRLRGVMSAREWAVCGSAYLLLMAAVGGVVPTK